MDSLSPENGSPTPSLDEVIDTMADYAERHILRGGRLIHVTRHMTGLFHGLAGARRYRRILAEEGSKPGAGASVLRVAASEVLQRFPAAA